VNALTGLRERHEFHIAPGVTDWLNDQPRAFMAFISVLGVLSVGGLDYLSGNEVSWSVIYIIPIAFAAWYVSARFAYGLGVLSVVLWIASDMATGVVFTSWVFPVWNAVIRIGLYYTFVRMLAYIKDLTGDLEARVAARTADLERMERELLEITERERRRFSADLHDGLGQHLTGTSLAAQVLRKQLAKRGLPEAQQAEGLIALIEEGIALSHKLAKGLQPVEMHSGGLMQALEDFAASASDLFKVSCRFRCEAPVLVPDVAVAEQLYRIAQEATSNAVKHGRARRIELALDVEEDGIALRITDNGIGFSYPGVALDGGLGLRIMAKRASLIGATFSVESHVGTGTTIVCQLAQSATAN